MPNVFEEYDNVLMAGTNLTLQQEKAMEQEQKDNSSKLVEELEDSPFSPTLTDLRRLLPNANQQDLNVLNSAILGRVAERRHL